MFPSFTVRATVSYHTAVLTVLVVRQTTGAVRRERSNSVKFKFRLSRIVRQYSLSLVEIERASSLSVQTITRTGTHSYITPSYLYNLTRVANSGRYSHVVFRESLFLMQKFQVRVEEAIIHCNPASFSELFTNNEIRCNNREISRAVSCTPNRKWLEVCSRPSVVRVPDVRLSVRSPYTRWYATCGRSSDISLLQRGSMKKKKPLRHRWTPARP
jgi:hypothetical protein